MREDSLQAVLKAIDVHRQHLIADIAQHVSVYWDWFQRQNEEILKLRKSNLTDKQLAHIAPVLEKRASGKKKAKADGEAEDVMGYTPKYYLLWKMFNNNPYRKSNRHASVHIPVSTPDKIISVVGKKCTWEFDMFRETEAKLAPLRVELDGLHEAEIKIRAAIRKYARKFAQ